MSCHIQSCQIFLFLRDFGDGNWLSSYDEIRQLNYSLHHISSHRTLCWSLRSIPLQWGIFQPKVFQEMINESWIVISIFNQLLSELTGRPKHSGTPCKSNKTNKIISQRSVQWCNKKVWENQQCASHDVIHEKKRMMMLRIVSKLIFLFYYVSGGDCRQWRCW